MSINIHKRIRTLTDEVYSDWSEWEITTDTPPYNNTSLVEYKTSSTYKESTLSTFADLMATSISESTPYSKTLDYLQTEFDEDNLTPKEKATLKAQVMSNITSSITNYAMQLSPTIANKELRITDELAMLLNQRDISDSTKQYKIDQAKEQAENIKQNALFVKEKITQLVKAAKDNNRIQAGKILEELFGQHSIANGGVITQDMFTLLFEMVLNMYNNADASIITDASSVTTS